MSTQQPSAAYGADPRRPVSAVRPPRTEGAGSVSVPKPKGKVLSLSQPKAEALAQSQPRVTGADIR